MMQASGPSTSLDLSGMLGRFCLVNFHTAFWFVEHTFVLLAIPKSIVVSEETLPISGSYRFDQTPWVCPYQPPATARPVGVAFISTFLVTTV